MVVILHAPVETHALAGSLKNWLLFFDADERASCFLADHTAGTAPHGEIQYHVAWIAVCLNDVLHQRQRLLCGMVVAGLLIAREELNITRVPTG